VADFVGFDNLFALEDNGLKTAAGRIALPGPVPQDARGLAWRPRAVTLGSGSFHGTVRGTSFAGDRREYLLDTPLGRIKAEVDASFPAHDVGSRLSFDLPVAAAAPLRRMD
jgi:putative spermidine/putrescine transport system ATP-binding protein